MQSHFQSWEWINHTALIRSATLSLRGKKKARLDGKNPRYQIADEQPKTPVSRWNSSHLITPALALDLQAVSRVLITHPPYYLSSLERVEHESYVFVSDATLSSSAATGLNHQADAQSQPGFASLLSQTTHKGPVCARVHGFQFISAALSLALNTNLPVNKSNPCK